MKEGFLIIKYLTKQKGTITMTVEKKYQGTGLAVKSGRRSDTADLPELEVYRRKPLIQAFPV